MIQTIKLTLLLISLIGVCFSHAEQPPRLTKGMPAPDWVLSDIEGQSHSLYDELEQGHQVIMVFWSSWCKFCKDLLPELNLFARTLGSDTTKIFAFNIWENGDPVGYFDTRQIDIPLFLNADTIAKRYGVSGTPGIVFIGKDGKINYLKNAGENTQTVMRALQLLVLGAGNQAG